MALGRIQITSPGSQNPIFDKLVPTPPPYHPPALANQCTAVTNTAHTAAALLACHIASMKSTRANIDADFARSCPDRDSMNCFGLMSELMSAVDILSARQNQWNSSNDAKSTIQVLEAAQSSTLLFVRKSVDEPDDEAGKPKDLRYFDEDSACSMFFRHSTCYDVLPESGKLLVLDSTLPIRRAMQALVDHSLSAAPVWCNRLQCYTQLLTTDLCLRLLAQAFPLDTASSSPSPATGSDEDVSVRKRNSDPNVMF
ncbi:unnamed protein product [Rodentolepis nana]|uniref:HSL_N domain-containing protein n=1 Tax=Rodentolepis nana TaxID=102285 RepID=A0A158QIB3_RODNA|nr:unnamed protein product [Rodentolepis nana]